MGKRSEKKFRKREDFELGCKGLGGSNVNELSKESNVSRQHVYNQISKLKKMSEEIDNPIDEEKDKAFIKRSVIAMALYCGGSLEGIQGYLSAVHNIDISIGTISNIINEASDRAKVIDESIDLSNVKIGANDEIFQCNEPIFVGVDPKSTYIYMMTLCEDRKSETWKEEMEILKSRGLSLKKSVNDAGTGLNKGIKDAFENIEIQADVFHVVKDLTTHLGYIEKNAYAEITKEEKATKALNKEEKKGLKKSD